MAPDGWMPAIRRAAMLGVALLSTTATAELKPPFALETQAITLADSSIESASGRLIPRGMLIVPTPVVEGQRMSQLSGLAWDADEGLLYALSDKGTLFHLRPSFTRGNLSRLELRRVVVLRGVDGNPLKSAERDAEGLDILNGRNGRRGDAELFVSFERKPRIARYGPDGKFIRAHQLPAPLNDASAYRGKNKMLEAVCHDRELGLVLAPELPLHGEPQGQTRLFDLGGKSWRYPIPAGRRISAVECLGDRRVLVLERDIGNLLGGSVIALNIATLPDTPAAVGTAQVDSVATLDAAHGFRLDNFEGLAHHEGDRFFIVSDDNDLFLQRTLLLYFEIAGSPAAKAN